MKNFLPLTLFLFFSFSLVYGQNTLDTTFAQTGVIYFDYGANAESIAFAVVTSPNMISYTAIVKAVDGVQSIDVSSHLADGSVNTAFGMNGNIELFLPPGTSVENIYVHYTADNHIIGLATVYNDFIGGNGYMMSKITSDGALVSSFGTNGVVEQIIPDIWFGITGIAVDAQQNIYVYGTRDNDDMQSPVYEYPFITKHLPNGQLDVNFANNGIFDFGLQFDGVVYDAALNANGELVVIGINYLLENLSFLAAIDSSGDLVEDFGFMGLVYINSDVAMLEPAGIYITADGNINAVLQGLELPNFNQILGIMQFSPNGILNTGFGTAGLSIVQMGSDFQFVLSTERLPNDGVIVNYIVIDIWADHIFSKIYKLNADGLLDESFGEEGVFVFDFEAQYNTVLGLHVASEEKLYTSGLILDFDTELVTAFVARLNLKTEVTSISTLKDSKLFEILVYPNPAIDFIQITAGNSTQLAETSLHLIDLNGRSVFSQSADFLYRKTHTMQIPASAPGGLYFIGVETADGIRLYKPVQVIR